MENKLIPLTEFINRIDELVTKKNNDNNLSLEIKQCRAIKRYAAFLSQPLKLEYFVPCDDEGNVLTEPEWSEPLSIEEQEVFEHDQYLYEKAQQKVLFEGFEVKNNQITNGEVTPYYIKEGKWTENEYIDSSIEGLVESNITLSATALKQIYG